MKLAVPAIIAVSFVLPVQATEHLQSVPLDQLSHIHGVVLPPGGGTLLATHNGLYSVDESGVASMVSAGPDDFMGFTASGSGQLYASGHPAGGGNMGVIGSEQAGEPWTLLSPGADGPVDFHAMSVSPADPLTIYGTYRSIQVSRDGGKTWSVSGELPGQVIDIAAAAGSASHLYAGTVAGLMESTDSGETWNNVGGVTAPVTATEVAPNGSLHLFVAGEGLYCLEPDGRLASLARIPGDDVFLHLAFSGTDPNKMVAVTSESLVISSVDAGKTWSPLAP